MADIATKYSITKLQGPHVDYTLDNTGARTGISSVTSYWGGTGTAQYDATDSKAVYVDADGNSTFNKTNEKGLSVQNMFAFVADQTDVVNEKLELIRASGETISITDMFEMQMKMNRLSQYSEMATSVVSAAGGAIQSIARNVK